MAPRPAKKLPSKIAKRWKIYREKNEVEEVHWDAVDEKKTKPPPMLNEPTGRREKAEAKVNSKKKKPKSGNW
jgi:hypothetical protein